MLACLNLEPQLGEISRRLALQMNLATVAVLHTAMALEDPFDNQGLDGIYVDEALFEAEQVTTSIALPKHILLRDPVKLISLCTA